MSVANMITRKAEAANAVGEDRTKDAFGHWLTTPLRPHTKSYIAE